MPCKKNKKKNMKKFLSGLKAGFKKTQKFIEENINPDVYSGNYMVPDYAIGLAGVYGFDFDIDTGLIDIPIKTSKKKYKR